MLIERLKLLSLMGCVSFDNKGFFMNFFKPTALHDELEQIVLERDSRIYGRSEASVPGSG